MCYTQSWSRVYLVYDDLQHFVTPVSCCLHVISKFLLLQIVKSKLCTGCSRYLSITTINLGWALQFSEMASTWIGSTKYHIYSQRFYHMSQTTMSKNFTLCYRILVWVMQSYTSLLNMNGSGKLRRGRGLCNMCDQWFQLTSLTEVGQACTLQSVTWARNASVKRKIL